MKTIIKLILLFTLFSCSKLPDPTPEVSESVTRIAHDGLNWTEYIYDTTWSNCQMYIHTTENIYIDAMLFQTLDYLLIVGEPCNPDTIPVLD